MTAEITFWGTRGGVPVSGPQFDDHGGATTHIELDLGDRVPYDRVLIDAGTGIVDMGNRREGELDDILLLQTHVHWDHIQGFPFFSPFFNAGVSVDIWGADREGEAVESVYRCQMERPMFPVGMEAFEADLSFRRLDREGEFDLGDARIAWTEMEHPSGSTAFRIDCGDASFVFSGDVEVRLGSRQRLVDFASGADVFLMDAQYLPDEYDQYEGFGHSTCCDAVDVAARADVSRVYLTHHDPGHTDDLLDRKRDVARRRADDDLFVDNARDRTTVTLPCDDHETGGDRVSEVAQ